MEQEYKCVVCGQSLEVSDGFCFYCGEPKWGKEFGTSFNPYEEFDHDSDTWIDLTDYELDKDNFLK